MHKVKTGVTVLLIALFGTGCLTNQPQSTPPSARDKTVTRAQPPAGEGIDISGYDVAGIKIGMSFDQARKIVAKHFSISPQKIKFGKTGIVNMTRVKEHPSFFSYANNKESIVVHFTPVVPFTDNMDVIVHSVGYSVSPNTKENQAEVAKAALAKYGRGVNSFTPEWCPRPIKYGLKNEFGDIYTCWHNDIALRVQSSSVTMSDPGLIALANDYANKIAKAQPKF